LRALCGALTAARDRRARLAATGRLATEGRTAMSENHVSPAEIEPHVVDAYEGRIAQLDGYNVAFEKMPAGFPPHELWRGLPDDHCPCPHWGYLVKGSFEISWADGSPSETVSAGDAYYLRPGHLITALEDIEVVEFSPAEEFQSMMAHVEGNAAALAG
jgi:hypothetical protein